MAETKTKFAKFLGPSYPSRVGRFDNERTVNLYLENCMAGSNSAPGSGKNEEPMVLIGMPGLTLLATLGTGPIRATYTVSNSNTVYIVSGNQVWQVLGGLSNVFLPDSATLVGTMMTSTGLVSVVDNGIEVVFVDGQYGYYATLLGPQILTQLTSVNFMPATTVTFQDGYFIFSQTGTAYYFISDLYTTNTLPLNQANKSGNSDLLQAVICNNRILYLLGQYTLETWWDSGQSGSTPFARQDGQFAQTGCISAGSVRRLFNTIIWLGSNPEGGAIIYMLENATPVRISNHAVEFSFQQADVTDLSNSVAYTWQIEGHYFYTINCPGLNTTWTFDLSTQQWFEQQSIVDGVIGRHLVQCHTAFNGVHIVGDYRNGNIYQYDFGAYTDNGTPIPRIRQCPHLAQNLNRVFYKLLEIDFTPGNAQATSNVLGPYNGGLGTFGSTGLANAAITADQDALIALWPAAVVTGNTIVYGPGNTYSRTYTTTVNP